jgi:2-C-methyl-D-erythritol 4-phosphate cytidylyltransferase
VTTTSGAPAPRLIVVLLAAGDGRRVGAATNKVFLPLQGEPVLAMPLRTIAAVTGLEELVVVVREADRPVVEALVERHCPGLRTRLVLGGASRHDSEWNALRAVAPRIDGDEVDVVAVCDAARPLAPPGLFRSVVDEAVAHGGALPVRAKRAMTSSGSAAPQGELVAVQTPQAFRAGPLLAAYRQAEAEGFRGTDTAACVERYADLVIRCIPSSATNLKITFPEDVEVAERLLRLLQAP